MTSPPLVDYYRCPTGSANFSLVGELSENCGYFRFGNDICFGRCSFGSPARHPWSALYDAAQDVRMEGGRSLLPFDPAQIIDNLRCERYATGPSVVAGSTLLRKAYYSLRPLLPVAIRKWLQKAYLRDWKKIRFPAWPVDCTVDRFCEGLLRLSLQTGTADRIPFIWFWPDGYSACVIMTHDIESLSGLKVCPTLMDLDESFGIKASFQIAPEANYQVSRTALDTFRARGFEVNVHDLNHDGGLYCNRAEFVRRASRINDYVNQFGAKGFRSGSLYRNPDWYEAFTFSYDMSIPNTAHLEPQRGGCCTVMPYFIGSILELPLTTTQDYSLFHILNDYSMELWERQIGLILERHGLVNFIIHPDYILERKAQRTYMSLLQYLQSLAPRRNLWMTLPGEVDSWWRQRSQMVIVEERGDWRVRGPGKERARLAYAMLVGDRIRYTLAGQSEH